MPRLVAFLRAINVGGHTVTMAELRRLFSGAGCQDVETFIASGNVVFTSRARDMPALERKLERQLQAALGYEVATFLRSDQEVLAVARHQPWTPAQLQRAVANNVGFFADRPGPLVAKALEAQRTDDDEFHIHGREVYWLCRKSYSERGFSSALLERTLKLRVTWRGVKTIVRLAGTLSMALLCPFAAPAAAQGAKPPAAWESFTRRFDAYVDTNRIVGASAMLVRDGRVIARHNVGFADRDGGRRVDERTLFHYGSITKTLTAITVLQLRDRGKLSLDDPVTRWIPELRQVHDPFGSMDSVTIRMLLSHTAGFQNPTWPYTEGRDWEPFEPTTWSQLVAMMPYQELRFKPGSRFGYSNPGFIYLARIVEIITGEPWVSYVQKNLFSPLGMSRSYFSTTPYYLAGDRSHGYDVQADSTTGRDVVVDHGADFDPGITIPNGGWNAPLDDLATYLGFLTGAASDAAPRHRQELVLSRQSLQEMWRPQANANVSTDSTGHRRDMGLGFMLDEDTAHFDVGHTGSQGGFEAFLHFNPQNRTGFVLVFNTTYHDSVVGRSVAMYEEMLQAAWGLIH